MDLQLEILVLEITISKKTILILYGKDMIKKLKTIKPISLINDSLKLLSIFI